MRRLAPRTILGRLALLFAASALLAVAAIYAAVVPSLGARLRAEKLTSLASAAQRFSAPVARTIGTSVNRAGEVRSVREASALSGDRVTLLAINSGSEGIGTSWITDSASPGQASGGLAFSIAAGAAKVGRMLTGAEQGVGGVIGEAALPLRFGSQVARVVVFSEPLGEVQSAVLSIRRRIAIAGAGALLVAALAGFLVARALSMRIQGLQRAARRVATGDFSARFATGADDELGRLAHELDNMQRQLAELDSARERFIATASHELRTPIFSLGGFLELIQDEDLDEDTRGQFLRQVREQVDRLGKLATGLLDLSRLEAGGLELTHQMADLCVIARTVASEFFPGLHQHSSRLRLRLEHERIPVVCDPERVAQILRILIDNALTHTREGTDIVLTAARLERGARVSVRDYGEGIDRAAIERIFEPFFTSDGVQGSGLGLAIAHELAERMGGRLSADSVPGRTVFTLELETG